MTKSPTLRQQVREIVKLFKFTETYGVNSDLPTDQILALLKDALPEKITSIHFTGETHTAQEIEQVALKNMEYKGHNSAVNLMHERLGIK